MRFYCFELIKFDRYGRKGLKLRIIVDGRCIREKNYYGDFSNFFIDSLRLKLMKLCNYFSTGNFEEPSKKVNGFEIVENAGEDNNDICIRYLKNGRCVATSMIYTNINEEQEKIIINNFKFLCKLNCKISKSQITEMKKNGLTPPEGTSYLEMQRKLQKIIS